MRKKVKKRASTLRPYNSGTMSESEMRTMILNKLRQLTSWWKPIRKTKIKAKGICQNCGKKTDKIKVDHTIPIVPVEGFTGDLFLNYNWTEYLRRAFIEEGPGLTALCQECHSQKSKSENEMRRFYKTKNKL